MHGARKCVSDDRRGRPHRSLSSCGKGWALELWQTFWLLGCWTRCRALFSSFFGSRQGSILLAGESSSLAGLRRGGLRLQLLRMRIGCVGSRRSTIHRTACEFAHSSTGPLPWEAADRSEQLRSEYRRHATVYAYLATEWLVGDTANGWSQDGCNVSAVAHEP